MGKYTFKIADNEAEYAMIAALNYETFAQEIPQHEENATAILQDKFHAENIYFIALEDNELLGMVALRDQRPFSLDLKLPDLNEYFDPQLKICEARLLSVKKYKRNSALAIRLFSMVGTFFFNNQYDILIISGIMRQQKLYAKLGLMPFGPIVGQGEASFQPMYLTQEFARLLLPVSIFNDTIDIAADTYNYLPGPVEHESNVSEALAQKALSHRGLDHKLLLGRVQWQLKKITNARHVQLFLGSGTLANDVVAGQLSLLNEPGLILSNGEFGNRLLAHAEGFGLPYKTFTAAYGHDLDLELLDQYLQTNEEIKWLWFVHLETSSGVVNDLAAILNIAAKYGLKVCVDCISSLGNIPVDVGGAYLASSVAGKGLCSYTGLAMVFYGHELTKPTKQLPCYIDLWKYSQLGGIPYSSSSNLLRALHQALENIDLENKFHAIKSTFEWTRQQLCSLGLHIVNNGSSGNVVLTIRLPQELCSANIGKQLECAGYKMHYQSSFLRGNNIVQIAFMSANALPISGDLVEAVATVLNVHPIPDLVMDTTY